MANNLSEIAVITCNWIVSNNKELRNCLSFIPANRDVDFEDLVTLESCISLRKNDGDVPELMLKIIKPDVAVSEVFIVSEARNVELYGEGNEYVGTIRGSNSDASDEDMAIFNARLKFNSPSPQCSIKFAGLKKDELWILGIGVALAPYTNSMANRVEQLLAGKHLSQSAEACKRVVVGHSSIPQVPSADSAKLKEVIEACFNQLETKLMDRIDKRFDELTIELRNVIKPEANN